MPRLRSGYLDEPHPRRLDPRHPRAAAIRSAHAAAMADGMPAYRDPATGYSVFTAAFLADRGTCCESGCRHCPFVGADDA